MTEKQTKDPEPKSTEKPAAKPVADGGVAAAQAIRDAQEKKGYIGPDKEN